MRIRRIPLVAVTLGALGLLPPVRARLKAIAVLADALGMSLPRPFASDLEISNIEFGGAKGDLYSPHRGAPGVVLIPGAALLGKNDPRVVRLAVALARAERNVFVPQLSLARRRLVLADITRLQNAARGLRDHTNARVVMLGFSYGGSFGLIAAADPSTGRALEHVAVFGAYFDLIGVLQAATTGISIVEEERFTWEPDPAVDEVVRGYGMRLVPPAQRPALEAALERGSGDELPDETRAVFDLLTNERPERTTDLIERLPQRPRRLIERFSPAAVSDRIRPPVLAMHSRGDPAVPFAEILRLERGLPGARVVKISSFHHVDFGGLRALRATADLLQVWRFASLVLSSQE